MHNLPPDAAAITRWKCAQSRSSQRSLHPCCNTSTGAARMSRSAARGWDESRYHLRAVVKPARPYRATSSHALAACLGYDEVGYSKCGCSAPACLREEGLATGAALMLLRFYCRLDRTGYGFAQTKDPLLSNTARSVPQRRTAQSERRILLLTPAIPRLANTLGIEGQH